MLIAADRRGVAVDDDILAHTRTGNVEIRRTGRLDIVAVPLTFNRASSRQRGAGELFFLDTDIKIDRRIQKWSLSIRL